MCFYICIFEIFLVPFQNYHSNILDNSTCVGLGVGVGMGSKADNFFDEHLCLHLRKFVGFLKKLPFLVE